tara:strand:+ start:10311 stop:13121 length:2811 start_codon:yes stop_codon:yes gene_type:complete
MATQGSERELLTKGLEQDGVVRGVWAQNMWLAQGAVSVRPGWGVLSELDTTLGNDLTYNVATAPAKYFTNNAFGYEKHLGSCYVKTVFGNEQILSVFLARVQVGSLGADARLGRVSLVYCVRIYDITTDRSWEEVLTRKTAEFGSSSKLEDITASGTFPSEWHGSYETAFDIDNTQFVSGKSNSEWFLFTNRGYIYFGSSVAGVFIYKPADFGYKRHVQTPLDSLFNWSPGHSESALIDRVDFSDGIFSDGFVYANKSNISKIVAAASFRGRIAYATDFEIWFSDPGRPTNVIATNFINVPSTEKVTAMYDFKGNLIIFTITEMFVYVPSEGAIISQGRPPIKVSESVGCIGQQAITMMEDDLVWVADSGVFLSSGGNSIKEISEPIRAFFGGHGLMTNPMTSYYEANNGWVDIDTVSPPRTLLSFNPDQVTLAYNHDKRTLLMGCPEINGAWAFGGLWSWWPMETTVKGSAVGVPIVSTTANLLRPWVIGTTTDFYSICGVNSDAIPDSGETIISGTVNTYPDFATLTTPAAPANGSNFIACKLGHGGSLDRSSYKEDNRLGCGKYVPAIPPDTAFNNGCYYFEAPLEEESIATGSTYWWLPIEVVPPNSVTGITGYDLRFRFDETEWNPDATGATFDVTVRFPTERVVSGAAIFATAGGYAQRTDAAGTPAVAGEYITIKCNGNHAAASGWTTDPNLNIGTRIKNPLIYVRFRKVTANSVNGMGIAPILATIDHAGAAFATPLGALVWIQTWIGAADSDNNNAKVQSVDWAYKSDEESKGFFHLKARGIYAKMNSHGRGLQANRLVPNWVWGLYNVILGSDSKEYTSQIVDYDDDIQKIENKGTIRSRFRNTSGAMTTRTFSGDPKWGSQGNNFYGDYLIDDQQTDDIATSDSVKGQRISYMVFGFIQDKAEALSLQSLMGVFRKGGGRRRTGR